MGKIELEVLIKGGKDRSIVSRRNESHRRFDFQTVSVGEGREEEIRLGNSLEMSNTSRFLRHEAILHFNLGRRFEKTKLERALSHLLPLVISSNR